MPFTFIQKKNLKLALIFLISASLFYYIIKYKNIYFNSYHFSTITAIVGFLIWRFVKDTSWKWWGQWHTIAAIAYILAGMHLHHVIGTIELPWWSDRTSGWEIGTTIYILFLYGIQFLACIIPFTFIEQKNPRLALLFLISVSFYFFFNAFNNSILFSIFTAIAGYITWQFAKNRNRPQSTQDIIASMSSLIPKKSASDRLLELERLKLQGLLTEAEYLSQRESIIKEV